MRARWWNRGRSRRGRPVPDRPAYAVRLYLSAIALFAFAIGARLRHSAGALATVLGLLLVIENLFAISWKPLQMISPLLPGTAGSKLPKTHEQIDAASQGAVGAVLGPSQGFAVLLTWVAVLLAVGAVLLERRNALTIPSTRRVLVRMCRLGG